MSRFRIATIMASLSCALLVMFGQPARAEELQDIIQIYKQGQNDKALERLEAYLVSRPKDAHGTEIAQARFLKGLILAEQGKNPEAIAIFTKLTEEYPELPEPYNNLGVLYASQGQFEKSRLALEMAISTHPSYATAHENLGDIYAKMASQAYDKALQLDKGNVTAQTKLALIKELVTTSGKVNRAATKSDATKIAMAAPVPAAAAAPAKAEPPKPTAAPVVAVATTPAKAEPAKAAPAAAPIPVVPGPPLVPVPVPTPADKNADAEMAVLKAVNGWAKAWSSKSASGYLAYYARDFKTPAGQNRPTWEASRTERITAPRSIQVIVGSPRVTFSDAGHASVTFRQGYKSDILSTSATKTLDLTKVGDRWLIQQERVGR